MFPFSTPASHFLRTTVFSDDLFLRVSSDSAHSLSSSSDPLKSELCLSAITDETQPAEKKREDDRQDNRKVKVRNRVPHCDACRNHGFDMPKKGHRFCPFDKCNCPKCLLLLEKRIVLRHQIEIRRKLFKNESKTGKTNDKPNSKKKTIRKDRSCKGVSQKQEKDNCEAKNQRQETSSQVNATVIPLNAMQTLRHLIQSRQCYVPSVVTVYALLKEANFNPFETLGKIITGRLESSIILKTDQLTNGSFTAEQEMHRNGLDFMMPESPPFHVPLSCNQANFVPASMPQSPLITQFSSPSSNYNTMHASSVVTSPFGCDYNHLRQSNVVNSAHLDFKYSFSQNEDNADATDDIVPTSYQPSSSPEVNVAAIPVICFPQSMNPDRK